MNGTTEIAPPPPLDPEESFLANTEPLLWSGCLIWTASTKGGGYGAIWVGDRTIGAHRYAWERAHGPIPDGMVVDHLCWQPLCCEVSHLRLATAAENARNRKPGRRSRSGIRNVYPMSGGGWRVQVQCEGRFYPGGYFAQDELDLAEIAAIKLRDSLFGEHGGDHYRKGS